MKYNLFIGRWSPFHEGHKYIIDSFVNNGRPVCVAIRESSEDYDIETRKRMIEKVYEGNDLVKVIIIPDIEQVVVGRGVGYSIVEAPEEIQKISGTGVRAGKCDKVPEQVKEIMDELS